MRFLIVRTDIRAAADDELAAVWAQGECLRDEQTAPEQRRQTVRADDRDAALLLARALSSVGAVRSGRQRVKVLPVGRPARRLCEEPDRGPVSELNGSHPGELNAGHPTELNGSHDPQPINLGPPTSLAYTTVVDRAASPARHEPHTATTAHDLGP